MFRVSEGRRLEAIFKREIDFVARLLRNMGVVERDVDDAVQQVFIVFSRKLAQIPPDAERGFLVRTAINIAAHNRRSLARKREELGEIPEFEFIQPGADDLLDTQRARALLDQVLAKMDYNARVVFVLHEIEQRTMSEIALEFGLPPGTVATRLRRGRFVFQRELGRLRRVIDFEAGLLTAAHGAREPAKPARGS